MLEHERGVRGVLTGHTLQREAQERASLNKTGVTHLKDALSLYEKVYAFPRDSRIFFWISKAR